VEGLSLSLFEGLAGTLLGTLLIVLLVGLVGYTLSLRHLRLVRDREGLLRDFLATTCDKERPQETVLSSSLVIGSAVFTIDYFQKLFTLPFLMIGGRVRAYEFLLRRARAEAFIRMREEAMDAGADCVINVRFETSTISLLSHIGCIEVLAYGTLLVFDVSTERSTLSPRGVSSS
jgi:uncharacterized protein YbjQ (UPF0145 family)